MQVYVEQEIKRRSAEEATGAAAAIDRVIVRLDDPDDILAGAWWGNTLAGEWPGEAAWPASRLVTFSGSLAPTLAESHPANWLTPGRAALDQFCQASAPALEGSGRRLCLQPHARHVLSDAPSCVSFLDAHVNQPFDLLLAAMDMVEPAMVPEIHEHLARTFDVLADRCVAVLLTDLDPRGDGQLPAKVPLGRGLLTRDLVRSLLDRVDLERTPIILLPEAAHEQVCWLGG